MTDAELAAAGTEITRKRGTDMTAKQQLDEAIKRAEQEGYIIAIWTPEEVGEADGGALLDIVIERGNNFLEWSKTDEEA